MQFVQCSQLLSQLTTMLSTATPTEKTAFMAALNSAGLCGEIGACVVNQAKVPVMDCNNVVQGYLLQNP
jgi:hypothetical protein